MRNFKFQMSNLTLAGSNLSRPLGLTLLLAVGFAASGAQPVSVFDQCTELQSVLFLENAVVRIQCDTAYILNSLTFHLYDNPYRDLRSGGPAIENLLSAYDDIIKVQEDRLRSQQTAYAELRQRFGEISTLSESTLEESSRRLTQAVSSMEILNSDLVQTKLLLDEAREIIQSEKRSFNLEKILWGVGGVAAGVVVGVLIAR